MADDYPFSPYPNPSSSPEEPARWQPPSHTQPPSYSVPPISSGGDVGEKQEDEMDGAALKNAIGIFVAVLVIVVLVAGGVWYFLTRNSGSEPKSEETPDSSEIAEEADENLIVAAAGGKIVSQDGFEVMVPPGALSVDTVIEVERRESGDVTDLYELQPTGLKFLKPVTLSIPYKTSGLKKGETPWNIILEYWSEATEAPRTKLKYTVDEKEKKLRTQVKRF